MVVQLVRERSESREGLIRNKLMGLGVKGLEISTKLKKEAVEVKTRRGRNIEGYRRS